MSESIDLTVRQIQAMAEFAGLTVSDTNPSPLDMSRIYTVTDTPPQPSQITGLVVYVTINDVLTMDPL